MIFGEYLLAYFINDVAPPGEANGALLVPSAAWREGFLDFWACIGRDSEEYWDTEGSGAQGRVVRFFNLESFFDPALGSLGLDDPNVSSIVHRIDRRTLTYAVNRKAKVTATEIVFKGMMTEFTVYTNGDRLGRIELPMPGVHNVYNALAAVCVGLEVGVPFGPISDALCEFEGVSRRFEILGERGGITVLDDYGHHPTEIEAVLKAAAAVWPSRRKVAVFQPHRYSRTQALCHTFGTCFDRAELVLLADIYPAGERKMVGVSSHLILEAARDHGHRAVYYVGDLASAQESLSRQVRPGDVVITLGAGDVWKVGVEFLQRADSNVNSQGGARV